MESNRLMLVTKNTKITSRRFGNKFKRDWFVIGIWK